MKLFILLDWHPALGVAADPAGVLGLAEDAGGRCTHYVSWIPRTAITACGWRARLTIAPTMAAVRRWLAEQGICQLAEIPVPTGTASLPDAVEAAVDMLLAEVIPRLPSWEPR
jgi:hypothetical protein